MGRTSKNIKLRIPEKLHKIKGFRSGSYRVATTISSQPRYDHFDTSPCMSNGLCRLISVHVLEVKHIVVDIHAHLADAHTALDLHFLDVLMDELLDLIGLADVLERKLRDALIR